jgi:hypothetical protein
LSRILFDFEVVQGGREGREKQSQIHKFGKICGVRIHKFKEKGL